MGYDNVLSELGDFGRYQRRIYILLCLPAISCAFHKLAWVFLGAKADHRFVQRNFKNTMIYKNFKHKFLTLMCLRSGLLQDCQYHPIFELPNTIEPR